MFSSPTWQKFALLLNFFGTAILFYSFQASSSRFRLITAPSSDPLDIGQYALCIDDYGLIASDGHNGVALGTTKCPNFDKGKPAAVVNIEHPTFEGIGFSMLLLGFAIQFAGIQSTETISDLRRQLKVAKMKDQE